MTHDFKKGDPVILEDGRAGILKNVLVCIAEVEVDRHYKYVDVKTLKHNTKTIGVCVCSHLEFIHDSNGKCWSGSCLCIYFSQKENRAGEAVAELETIPACPHGEAQRFVDMFHHTGACVNEWKEYVNESDIPAIAASWAKTAAGKQTYSEYEKIMADGCDPEPIIPCQRGCPADDGPEVEILRRKL